MPHWLWATCCILVPFCLTALGFLGLSPELLVPLNVAAAAPRLAVLVSLGGLAAAVIHRRRATVGIAAFGAAASVSGLLLLMWLS